MGLCFSVPRSHLSKSSHDIGTQTSLSPRDHGYLLLEEPSPLSPKHLGEMMAVRRDRKTNSITSCSSGDSDSTPRRHLVVQDILHHRFVRSLDENLYRISIDRYNYALQQIHVSPEPLELNRTRRIAHR